MSSEQTYSAPSGPYIVGVRDGEITDAAYPSNFDFDADGRRIPFRVWYPASAETTRRPYFQGAEGEAIIGGFGGVIAVSLNAMLPEDQRLDNAGISAMFQPLSDITTYSHVDAPVADGRFPVVLYSHGATGYLQQNLPLMEHLASHGYVVFSMHHPGGSAAATYADGTIQPLDASFTGAMMELSATEGFAAKYGPDIQVRWDKTVETLNGSLSFPGFLQRWIDDHKALADALQDGSSGLPEIEAICDLDQLASAGMSYGGATGATGAQQDDRVKVAINIDGGEWLPDLFDTDIRVPLLAIASDHGKLGAMLGQDRIAYANEFYYEPAATVGSREDVLRVELPRTSHVELTDLIFLDKADLRRLPGCGDAAPITDVVKPINDLVLGFLDHTLKGHDNGWPKAQLDANPDLQPMDMTYLRDWAAESRNAS